MNESSQNPVDTNLRINDQRAFRADCLLLIEFLAHSAGIQIDPVETHDAIARAEIEIGESWQSSWIERLRRIGKDLGFLIVVEEGVPADIRRLGERRLATFDSESSCWHVFDGKCFRQLRSIGHQADGRTDGQVLLDGDIGVRRWIVAQAMKPYRALESAANKVHHKTHGISPVRRLLGLLSEDKNDLWVIALFALGIGIFSLATPIAVEAIVSTVQGGTMILFQPVIALSLVLLVFLLIAAGLHVAKAYVVEFLQQRVFVRVVLDLACRLPRVQQATMDREHGPELVNRFFDVLTVQKASAVLLVDGLSVVLQTAIGLAVLAFFNPYLLGFDIVLMAAIAFIVFVLGRGAVGTSIGESYAKYAVAGWLEEIARHYTVFKHIGGADYVLLRANQLAGKYVHARRAHFKIFFRQVLFSLILQAVASAALFGLGGWLVINRGLTLGQLVAAELILTMIVGSLIKLGKSLESYYDIAAAVDKLGHLIDLPLESDGAEGLPNPKTPAGIVFRKVTFGYPTTPSKPLFNFMNLGILPGQHTAISGSHTSGKSTLLDLMYRLRTPEEGYIELDKRNVQQIRLEAFREQVHLVRGAGIFHGTILDNLILGSTYSDDTIRTVLERIGLLDEIQALPGGLKTMLVTGGTPLSTGQTRKLMIARAILASPRMMLVDGILDEMYDIEKKRMLAILAAEDAPWTLVVTTNSSQVIEACKKHVELEGSMN